MEIRHESRNILIIEDDTTYQNNLKIVCELLGHKVVGAYEKGSPEAEEKLERSDLLLVDVNLPGGESGVEFVKRTHKDHPVPVIYITGNIEERTFDKATNRLMHGYLPKPISKDQLDFAIKVSSLRNQYESALQEQLKKYYKKEKMIELGKFAGGLIHDLNNFNSIVLTGTNMAHSYCEENQFKGEHNQLISYIDASKRGAEKIGSITNAYRKILRNEINIEHKEISTKKLFEELRFYFRTRLKDQNIDLYIENDKDTNYRIFSSDILLLQSLVNLVSNSIDAIVDSQQKERWIRLSAKPSGDDFFFWVSDSGPGISKENQEKIFDPGFTTKVEDGQSGTGYGLSFVKENIQTNLSGDLRYLADKEFATFEIKIPYTKGQKEMKES